MDAARDIAELRRRAQWYRDFAHVGSADSKELRLSLADHFDRRADELEQQIPKGEAR